MEARAARDLWRDVAPLAGSPASPLWWIGDRLTSSRSCPSSRRSSPGVPPSGGSGIGCPSSRARRPAPQLRPAPRRPPGGSGDRLPQLPQRPQLRPAPRRPPGGSGTCPGSWPSSTRSAARCLVRQVIPGPGCPALQPREKGQEGTIGELGG